MASNPQVRSTDEGYALAALLVAIAVMAVLMTAAIPVWSTSAKREKEAELIFRGEQYARAIGLYQRKTGPGTLPPSIDFLVEQKFLRKKYKDPITNDDFQLLSAGQGAAAPGQQVGAVGQVTAPGARGGLSQAMLQIERARTQLGAAGRGAQAGPVLGGISGVASKSTETSLRLYNNRNKYNEWTFVFVQQAQAAGQQLPGRGGQTQPFPGRGRAGTNPLNPGRAGNPPFGGRGAQPGPAGGGRGQRGF